MAPPPYTEHGKIMRLIHTADWHLGRLFHGLYLTEDQSHILDRFIELAIEEEVDVALISGDVYDRAVPPADAVRLLDDVLSRLILDAHITVIYDRRQSRQSPSPELRITVDGSQRAPT